MKNTRKKDQKITPQPLELHIRIPDPRVWRTYRFAEDWFRDARNEANGTDHNCRRREILFAVCCAESYIVEWVRDEILNRDFDIFKEYFRPGDKMPVVDKWKDIPKRLKKENLIPNTPDLGVRYWTEFKKLCEYRNGLVHARASRPESSSQSQPERPLPSREMLDQIPARWAVNVVVELIDKLHEAVGTSAPDWLERVGTK